MKKVQFLVLSFVVFVSTMLYFSRSSYSISYAMEYQIAQYWSIVTGVPTSISKVSGQNMTVTDNNSSIAPLRGGASAYRVGLAQGWGGPISVYANVSIQVVDACLVASGSGTRRGFDSSSVLYRATVNGVNTPWKNGSFGYSLDRKYGRMYISIPGSYFGVAYNVDGWLDLSGVSATPVSSPTPIPNCIK